MSLPMNISMQRTITQTFNEDISYVFCLFTVAIVCLFSLYTFRFIYKLIVSHLVCAIMYAIIIVIARALVAT